MPDFVSHISLKENQLFVVTRMIKWIVILTAYLALTSILTTSHAIAIECRNTEFEGIHIGMTESEFRHKFSKCYERLSYTNNLVFEHAKIIDYVECNPIPIDYNGWRIEWIRFYKDVLSFVTFHKYWDNPRTVNDIIRNTKFPKDGWKLSADLPSSYEGLSAVLQCDDLEFNVSTGRHPAKVIAKTNKARDYADPPRIHIEDMRNDVPDEVLAKAVTDNKLATVSNPLKNFEVSRFYSITNDYAIAVVESYRTMRIKCVARGSDGKAIGVASNKITPPADEVVIYFI